MTTVQIQTLSTTHRHSVPLGANDGHLRRDLAWEEAYQRCACRLSHETRRRCDDAELHVWVRFEISIG